MAAVTNYQQFSGLKQQNFFLSQFWKPEVQNQCHWLEIRVCRAVLPPVAPPGESPFLALPGFWGYQRSLDCDYITPVFASLATSLPPLLWVGGLSKITRNCQAGSKLGTSVIIAVVLEFWVLVLACSDPVHECLGRCLHLLGLPLPSWMTGLTWWHQSPLQAWVPSVVLSVLHIWEPPAPRWSWSSPLRGPWDAVFPSAPRPRRARQDHSPPLPGSGAQTTSVSSAATSGSSFHKSCKTWPWDNPRSWCGFFFFFFFPLSSANRK